MSYTHYYNTIPFYTHKVKNENEKNHKMKMCLEFFGIQTQNRDSYFACDMLGEKNEGNGMNDVINCMSHFPLYRTPFPFYFYNIMMEPEPLSFLSYGIF